MPSNYETALKAEQKRCVRGFHRHSATTRADMAASPRLGHRQRNEIGQTFWTHPRLGNVCFPTRIAAARAALEA